MKKTFRRLISAALVLVFSLALTTSVLAVDLSLNDGSITANATTYSQGSVVDAVHGGQITVTSNGTAIGKIDVTLDSTESLNLTLDNLQANYAGDTVLKLTGGGTLNVELDGRNALANPMAGSDGNTIEAKDSTIVFTDSAENSRASLTVYASANRATANVTGIDATGGSVTIDSVDVGINVAANGARPQSAVGIAAEDVTHKNSRLNIEVCATDAAAQKQSAGILATGTFTEEGGTAGVTAGRGYNSYGIKADNIETELGRVTATTGAAQNEEIPFYAESDMTISATFMEATRSAIGGEMDYGYAAGESMTLDGFMTILLAHNAGYHVGALDAEGATPEPASGYYLNYQSGSENINDSVTGTSAYAHAVLAVYPIKTHYYWSGAKTAYIVTTFYGSRLTDASVAADALSTLQSGRGEPLASFELGFEGKAPLGEYELHLLIGEEHAGESVVIAALVDGAVVAYEAVVDAQGFAALRVDHLGSFAVFVQ